MNGLPHCLGHARGGVPGTTPVWGHTCLQGQQGRQAAVGSRSHTCAMCPGQARNPCFSFLSTDK